MIECRSCTVELPARSYPEAIERYKDDLCEYAAVLAERQKGR